MEGKKTFEGRLQVYNLYLWKVAERYKGRGPMSSADDLHQELLLSFWKCHEKYPDRTDKDFHDLLIAAIKNTVATHFRLACHKHDNENASLDAESSAGAGGGRKKSLRDSLRGPTEVGDEFFSARIVEILGKVPPGTAAEIMEALDPKSGKKLTAKSGCFFEVQKVLDGE
jgi:DNA-directed RNA polymerase specialized sigma24 family protein